jgi:hypothetical protein
MIFPVELTSEMPAFEAVRVEDHAGMDLRRKADGAGDEAPEVMLQATVYSRDFP